MSDDWGYRHLGDGDIEELISLFQEVRIPDVERFVCNRFNTNGLTNNCFFVTLAYLLGTDARALALRFRQEAGPVEMFSAFDILRRLGLRYEAWQFSDGETGRPFRGSIAHSRPENLVLGRALNPYPVRPRLVGVAYVHREREGYENAGHVVVCRSPGTPYRRFVDYQRVGSGVDVTAEVRRSRVSMIFSIDPQGGSAFMREQRPQIERMEVEEQSEAAGRQAIDDNDEPMEVDPYPHNELRR